MSSDTKQHETLMSRLWRLTHSSTPPYYCYYSVFQIVSKPIRKWFSVVFIPTIPFSGLRIWMYRRCGYKIGKRCFIGMRCYLDDMCYDHIVISDDVTISYGVFMACHGRRQGHNHITINDGAYIGMNASIVARTDISIGKNAIVGACTLVNKSIPDDATAVGIPCRIIPKDQ